MTHSTQPAVLVPTGIIHLPMGHDEALYYLFLSARSMVTKNMTGIIDSWLINGIATL
jgi:hypothetical protein